MVLGGWAAGLDETADPLADARSPIADLHRDASRSTPGLLGSRQTHTIGVVAMGARGGADAPTGGEHPSHRGLGETDRAILHPESWSGHLSERYGRRGTSPTPQTTERVILGAQKENILGVPPLIAVHGRSARRRLPLMNHV